MKKITLIFISLLFLSIISTNIFGINKPLTKPSATSNKKGVKVDKPSQPISANKDEENKEPSSTTKPKFDIKYYPLLSVSTENLPVTNVQYDLTSYYKQPEKPFGWGFGIESSFNKFLQNDFKDSPSESVGVIIHDVFGRVFNLSLRFLLSVANTEVFPAHDGTNGTLNGPSYGVIGMTFYIKDIIYLRPGVGFWYGKIKDYQDKNSKVDKSIAGGIITIGTGLELRISRFEAIYFGLDYYYTDSSIDTDKKIKLSYLGLAFGIVFY